MVCIFHVSELCWACSKFPCTWRVLFTPYLGLILLSQFPGGLKNLLLSTHLRIFDFRFWITELPVSWCLAGSFSFIVIPRIDSRSQKLDEEVSSLNWLRITRFTSLAFAVGDHRSRSCSVLASTWHQSQYALQLQRQNYWNGYKNTSRNSRMSAIWCEKIWFGFWGPNWSCQTTNQEQLCEFWTHVSSSDFVLQLSFWSRLRSLQRCTTEIQLEKNVCWWVRNPLHSTAQPFVFFWHVGSWFWNQELPQFPGGSFVWVEPCCQLNVTLQSPCPKDRGQVTHPCVIQRPEKWPQTLWSCARQKFVFLHIQLTGTNVLLPKIHKTPPEVDFESSRSPAKSESWNKPSLQCCAVFPTWQYCRKSLVWWMYEINLSNRLSHAWVLFVTALANLLTDQKTSNLPIRAKYKHFKTLCDHTFDNSPTDSSSSFLKWWSSKQRLQTLYKCSVFLFASLQHLSTQFWACASIQDHATVFAWGLSHPGNFSVAPAEIRDSNIFVYSSTTISFGLNPRWLYPKYTWSRSDVGSSVSTFFIHVFHVRAIFWFFPAILMSSTFSDRNNPCFRWTNMHSECGISLIQILMKLLRIVFPMAIRLMDDRTSVD